MSKFNNDGKLISIEGVTAENVIAVIDSSISIDGNFLTKERKGSSKGNEVQTKLSSLLLLDGKQQTTESELVGVKCGIPSNISENIGRGKELVTIEKLLAKQRFVVICGMAGVGKTLTALNFVHKWVPGRFHTALLINMDNEDTVRDSLRSFLSYLNIKPNSSVLENIKIIYAFFASHNLLVILDNIVDKNEQFHYLWSEATNRNIFILGTSQDEKFVHQFVPVKLNVLTPDDGVKLLRKELGVCGAQFDIDNSESIAELVRILEFHPLAINLSAAIIADAYKNDVKYSISDYVKEHGAKMANLVDFGRKTVHVAIKTNIERIKLTRNGAYELLCYMSLIDPTDINTRIFDIASGFAAFDVKAALDDLRRYSIVEMHGNVIRIHRLFQLINQKMLMDDDQFDLYKKLVFQTLMLCSESEMNVDVHYKYVLQFFSEEDIRNGYEQAYGFGILKDKLESDLEVVNSLTGTCCSSKRTKVDGWKAWHYAAYSAHGQVIKKLIALNVSIEVTTRKGWSVLHSIVMNTKTSTKTFLSEEFLQNFKLIPKKSVHEAMSLFMKITKKLTSKIHVLNMEMFFRLADKKGLKKFYVPLIKKRKNEMDDSFLLAAWGGFDEVVQLFIDAKYDLNVQKHNTTPLHIAVVNGNLTAVKKLVDAGADVNLSNDINTNPVFAAASNDNVDIFRYLTDCANFDIKRTYTELNLSLLQSAVVAGHVNIIKHVFHILKANNDARVSEKDYIQEAGPYGMNLLHLAAFKGNLNVVKYFANFNVNFNLNDDCGFTAFNWAIRNRHVQLVKYLTRLEMDKSDSHLDQKIIDGYTPLLVAVEAGDVKMVEHFVDCNANFLQKTDDGNGMLHVAAREGHLDVIIYITTKFIENICTLSEKNKYGHTPLHLASLQGHKSVVEYLVEFYKDDANDDDQISFLFDKNVDGYTALDVAIYNGHLNVVEYISKLYLSSFVYSMDDDGWTPLHSAADRGHLNVLKFIITFELDKHDSSLKSLLERKNTHGNTPIHQASLRGHLDVVRHLIDAIIRKDESILNSLLDEKNNKQQTPLHLSVFNGHYETVKYLAGFYATLNHISENDFSILHIAAQEGRLEIIKCLVDSESDKRNGKTIMDMWIRQKTTFGDTPLHSASKRGHVSVVKYFRSFDDRNNVIFGMKNHSGYTPRHHAALFGHLDVVKYIDSFMDPHYDCNNYGFTALLSAAMEGCIDVVEYLVTSNADIQQLLHETNNDGNSALHLAALRGHENVVKYITTSSCLERTNVRGATPLIMAVAGGHMNVIKYFVDLNANIYHTGAEDVTALLVAADRGHLDVIKYFISLMEDETSIQSFINAKTNGQTALHIAAFRGHLDVVKYLIGLGSNFGADGNAILHTAASEGHVDVVEYLVELGSNIDEVDDEGWTPLFWAARNGHVRIVEYLVSLGGSYKMSDKNGRTPLHVAAMNGHSPVVEYLVGIDSDFHDVDGYAPIQSATLQGHVDVVKYLVSLTDLKSYFEQKTAGGDSILHLAAVAGRSDIFKYLVSALGAVLDEDVSLKFYLNEKNHDGMTPFTCAVEYGHLEIIQFVFGVFNSKEMVEMLFEKVAGSTPLHVAIKNDRVDAVRYIIEFIRNVEEGEVSILQSLLEQKNKSGYTPLHLAALHNCGSVMKYMINFYTNVHTTCDEGFTALHLASQEGHLDIVKHVVSFQNDNSLEYLLRKTSIGNTPLHEAARNGQLNVVDFFITLINSARCNEDVGLLKQHLFQENNDGYTPLELAAIGEHLDVVQYIINIPSGLNSLLSFHLDHKNIFGSTIVHSVILGGKINVLRYFVDVINNTDYSLKQYLQRTNDEGNSMIHIAAYNGDVNVVKYIINAYANSDLSSREASLKTYLQQGNSEGYSCLHIAAMTGQVHVFEYFVSLDVLNDTTVLESFLQQETISGHTVLHSSVFSGRLEMVECIMNIAVHLDKKSGFSAKAYFNQKDVDENTLLLLGAFNGCLDVVEYLFDSEMTINGDLKNCLFYANKNKCTMLHAASFGGSLDVVEYIVGRCLDLIEFPLVSYVNRANKDGITALHLAAELGRLEIFDYFVTFGADILQKAGDGSTNLHFAASKGHMNIVKYLIDFAKSDEGVLLMYVEQRNNFGFTARELAGLNGRIDVMEYLSNFQKNDDLVNENE